MQLHAILASHFHNNSTSCNNYEQLSMQIVLDLPADLTKNQKEQEKGIMWPISTLFGGVCKDKRTYNPYKWMEIKQGLLIWYH